MKKCFLVCVILLIGASLFSTTAQEFEHPGIKVSITEFGYPLIPNASQVSVQIPIRRELWSGMTTELKFDVWYRAISPYFLPDIFFEVGVVPSINLLKEGKSKLFIGFGTAYSQTSEHVSIPAIIPIEYCYAPFAFMDVNLSLQNMIYGEGLLSELILSTTFHPVSDAIGIEVGGSANVALSWEEQYVQYSYGLLFGLGYRF
ncbi:MAG: hypothetical protein EOM68_20695 [Spirochaetia bacterium]|nr:hypothetical protein [Spirochaetia bacterium]